MSEGMDEATAIALAIAEMGDPVIVGAQLDRTHKPKTEWSMIILTVPLLISGQAIMYFIEATFLGGILASRSVTLLFNKSVSAVIIGIICMIAAYFIDFTIIGKYLERIFAGLCGFTLAFLTSARIHNGRIVSYDMPYLFSSSSAFNIPPFILVNLGLLISSPFCLPFISYGRTSTVINLFLVGLMLSVFKSGDLAWDKQKERSVPPVKDISKGLSS